MGFSCSRQALIERDERLVPAEGGREGSGEQGVPQASPAACNVALSLMLSAIIVEGSQTGQRCGFLATDTAEFGHADQDRQGGTLADPGDAEHEIQSGSQIVVSAQLSGDEADLGQPLCL